MCGIVGYIGASEAQPILLDGLKRLEYRGYDSAGIAVQQDSEIEVRKAAGKISVLEQHWRASRYGALAGSGTHGGPRMERRRR